VHASWLTETLLRCGASAHWVRECDDALVVREGFCTKESFAALPRDQLTHAYLSSIGIRGLGIQQVIMQLHADVCDEKE